MCDGRFPVLGVAAASQQSHFEMGSDCVCGSSVCSLNWRQSSTLTHSLSNTPPPPPQLIIKNSQERNAAEALTPRFNLYLLGCLTGCRFKSTQRLLNAFPPHENSSACVWIGLVPGTLLWWNQWKSKKQNVIVIFALHCLDPSHSCHWRERQADGRPITEQSLHIPPWRPVEQRYWTKSSGHPAELGRVFCPCICSDGDF